MKYLFFSILLLSLNRVIAQKEKYCNCSYTSHYSLTKLLTQSDSIGRTFLRKNHKELVVIASRAFSEATIMFIVKEKGKNKGFLYDLLYNKRSIVSGKKLDALINSITKDSTWLQTIKPLSGKDAPSNDFSFFISYRFPEQKLFEVCYSQLLRDIKRPTSYILMGFPYEYK